MENEFNNKLWEEVADDWDARVGSDGHGIYCRLLRW